MEEPKGGLAGMRLTGSQGSSVKPAVHSACLPGILEDGLRGWVGGVPGSWVCLAEGGRPGLVSEPRGQGFLWKDGGRGSVGNVAALMKGTRGWSCLPFGRTWTGTKFRSVFSRWRWASFGHLSGTKLGSDSWLCQGGALEKETVAEVGALWLSPVSFGS